MTMKCDTNLFCIYNKTGWKLLRETYVRENEYVISYNFDMQINNVIYTEKIVFFKYVKI